MAARDCTWFFQGHTYIFSIHCSWSDVWWQAASWVLAGSSHSRPERLSEIAPATEKYRFSALRGKTRSTRRNHSILGHTYDRLAYIYSLLSLYTVSRIYAILHIACIFNLQYFNVQLYSSPRNLMETEEWTKQFKNNYIWNLNNFYANLFFRFFRTNIFSFFLLIWFSTPSHHLTLYFFKGLVSQWIFIVHMFDCNSPFRYKSIAVIWIQ